MAVWLAAGDAAMRLGSGERTELTGCSVGMCLTDMLDDLINEGRMEPQLAMKMLSTFDRVVADVLADGVKARLSFKVCPEARLMAMAMAVATGMVVEFATAADALLSRLLQGHLDTYRFCDDVWTFLIKDVTFKLDDQNTVNAPKIKIVSCSTRRPGET